MASRLLQIIAFSNVGAGGQSSQAHALNIEGTAVVPDFVALDNADFEIVSVSTTAVTVQNNGGAPASCNVWLERKHTIDRALGGAILNLTPQPFVVTGGGGGGGGGVASAPMVPVEIVDATGVTGTLGNGVTYIPFVKDANDTIQFQFQAPQSDDYAVLLSYYMSTADVGDVQLRLDSLIVSDGDDPSAALSVGTPFTFTPGNDTNRHTLDDSVEASLVFTAVAEDTVVLKFTRVAGAPDTHPGDVRVLEIAIMAV